MAAATGSAWTLTNGILYVIFSDGGVARNTWLPSGNAGDIFIASSSNSFLDVEGLNIYFANYAVQAQNCPKVIIKNCYMEGDYAGIYINGSGHSDIEQNEISGAWGDALNVQGFASSANFTTLPILRF